MTKKNKKGFTLTELIVVITIIAILAAVLIPTSISFINKAKKSNDIQNASNMTKQLGIYCIENDINQNNLTGIEIRTILNGLKFNLIPSTSKWTYVYDSLNKKIIVQEFNNGILAAFDYNNAKDPSNIEENLYLIGNGKTSIEKAISALCNYNELVDYGILLDSLEGSVYEDLIRKFNPDTTLYVSNSELLSTPLTTINKIVFVEKTFNVPDLTSVNDKITSITLPELITNINTNTKTNMNDKFTNISSMRVKENIKKIDLTNFSLYKDSEGIVKSNIYRFGEYVDNTITQTFEVIIVGRTVNNDNKRALVYYTEICYYNLTGLYAKGYKYFLLETDTNQEIMSLYQNIPLDEIDLTTNY